MLYWTSLELTHRYAGMMVARIRLVLMAIMASISSLLSQLLAAQYQFDRFCIPTC